MNRIQSKDQRIIGTYELNKTSLPGFSEEIYIQRN